MARTSKTYFHKVPPLPIPPGSAKFDLFTGISFFLLGATVTGLAIASTVLGGIGFIILPIGLLCMAYGAGKIADVAKEKYTYHQRKEDYKTYIVSEARTLQAVEPNISPSRATERVALTRSANFADQQRANEKLNILVNTITGIATHEKGIHFASNYWVHHTLHLREKDFKEIIRSTIVDDFTQRAEANPNAIATPDTFMIYLDNSNFISSLCNSLKTTRKGGLENTTESIAELKNVIKTHINTAISHTTQRNSVSYMNVPGLGQRLATPPLSREISLPNVTTGTAPAVTVVG
jgi:hypothetical protein